jgi:transcriptional regulator with XRE-family HTH domain
MGYDQQVLDMTHGFCDRCTVSQPDSSAHDRERLGALVRAERLNRRLTQKRAAEIAGFSESTWSRIENGRTDSDDYEDATLIGVDDVVRWERGSARKVLEGGNPTPSPVLTQEQADRLISGEVTFDGLDLNANRIDVSGLPSEHVRLVQGIIQLIRELQA